MLPAARRQKGRRDTRRPALEGPADRAADPAYTSSRPGGSAMTWIKLPDTWHDDPRVLALPDAAQAAFVRLLSWCASHRTDGRYDAATARSCRVHHSSMTALSASGLVIYEAGIGQVVNPENYIFTEAKRAQKRVAGIAGAEARWMAPAMAPAMQGAMAVPSRPVP